MSKKRDEESKDLKESKRVLVVGDWLVDECWVTGIHRSLTGSRTGRLHSRALHPLNGTTQSFCGAGQTAAILHKAVYKNKKFCEVVGVGIWHKDDTDTLAEMLNPEKAEGQTLHKIVRKPALRGTERLFNLEDILKRNHGTTRVIRIYQHTGAKIDLIQRLDWELRVSPAGWIDENNKQFLENSALNKFLEETSFDAVVIKDLYKGVISKEMVKWLASKESLQDIPWFVSSKEWEPDWLDDLPKEKLELLVIPQVAAGNAVYDGILKNWITKSSDTSNASKEAFDEIDKLANKFNDKPFIVVLPEGLSIFARDRRKDKREGWLQTATEPRPSLAVEMPMASVFYPALVANLLNDKDIALKELLQKALDFTQKWMRFEVKRVTEPDSWNPKEKPAIDLDFKKELNKIEEVGDWKPFSWEVAKNEWGQSLSNQGIIEKENKKYLELWRATTDVDGYVCCVSSKLGRLQQLAQEIKNFKSKENRHSISYMLIDSPGSGKTFLVRCLARSLGLQYLPFNITQMLSKKDILDCFDTIVTTQALNKGGTVLVFFDEINAALETQQVYDTFLAPLEEEVYVRAGKAFHIDPCVWIFAGTERPVKEGDEKRNSSTKASDFESRLTLPPFDLKINMKNTVEQNEARVEKVYLGVSLLRKEFPDVRRVSERVLELFHFFNPDLQVREIEHFVKAFTNIQYGDVLVNNVPVKWLEKQDWIKHVDLGNWKRQSHNEGDKVEIIG